MYKGSLFNNDRNNMPKVLGNTKENRARRDPYQKLVFLFQELRNKHNKLARIVQNIDSYLSRTKSDYNEAREDFKAAQVLVDLGKSLQLDTEEDLKY